MVQLSYTKPMLLQNLFLQLGVMAPTWADQRLPGALSTIEQEQL
jgi:hypothetical protein